jgi:hypothetical protein
VVIADPHSCAEAAPGHVGEIWVAGASVGQGYWRRPGQTRRSLDARLSDTGEGPFLRTGDLGFMAEGQLYVTGRLDDLIIVRGLNRYPQEIEATARGSHPLLESGYAAAFVADDHGPQLLVLVQEVARKGEVDFVSLLDAVRGAVLDEHGLALGAVVLVRSGTIPRTSAARSSAMPVAPPFWPGNSNLSPKMSGSPVDDAGQSGHPPGVEDAGSHGASRLAILAGRSGRRPPARSCLGRRTFARSDTGHTHCRSGAGFAAARTSWPRWKTFAGRLPDTVFSQARTLEDLVQAVQKAPDRWPQARCPYRPGPARTLRFGLLPEYGELKRQERCCWRPAPTRISASTRAKLGSAPGIEGRSVVSFSVYDYVGLAHDPEVAAAARSYAIDRYGTSAGASRAVSGESRCIVIWSGPWPPSGPPRPRSSSSPAMPPTSPPSATCSGR